MKKYRRSNPPGYDGSRLTGHQLTDLLPSVLNQVSSTFQQKGFMVMQAWPDLIGPQLAPMARATSFRDGMLEVRVSNSTLYSLLKQHEREKLLRQLRRRFPDELIRQIVFRMG